MESQTAKRYLIEGRVQGVFYRVSTQKKASELGITGWVRNLADGRVEVQAYGTAQQLTALENWLWQGPPNAQVERVENETIEWQVCEGFTVRSS